MEKHSIRAYLEYVGATVPYGTGWRKMRCPFHDDKHASAGVDEEKCKFKCFGCEARGDVYNLIQMKEGMTYSEAIQFAETISPTGNTKLRTKSPLGRRISTEQRVDGRRGEAISSGSGRYSITQSRKLRG